MCKFKSSADLGHRRCWCGSPTISGTPVGHPNGAKLVLAVKERNLPDDYVAVARRYKRPQCLAKAQPKSVRVATLQKPPHFNHTVAIDGFYTQWKEEKKAVLTVLDEFSRYEMDMLISEENAEMEIALLNSSWMMRFGFPKVLRRDASGPHQGAQFAEWASQHGMVLELIPRGAHRRLGILERNHAVRRKMLETFGAEVPEASLEEALRATCHQRNRLSSVKGSSPAAIAFGRVPSEGGKSDYPGPESFHDSSDQAKINKICEAAAVAFHRANQDLAIRTAFLHSARVEEDELFAGDYVFYWKPQTNKLDPFRWRGPCMVVAVEPMPYRSSMIYWIARGSSLVRATRQQLRYETVPERYERQSKPDYLPSMQKPLQQRLLEALRPVRGRVRAVDLSSMPLDDDLLGGPSSTDAPGDDDDDDDAPAHARPSRQLQKDSQPAPDATTVATTVDDATAPGGVWTDPGPPAETSTCRTRTRSRSSRPIWSCALEAETPQALSTLCSTTSQC